jgi:predicted AAA+ superfamily ATPase
MVNRGFWQRLIEEAWRRRSVVWLMGVRRSGKTFLCRSLPAIEYFDCELPRVRRELEDPQTFLESMRGRRVVLDEIHRLANPAEVLKIAADHYPETRVLGTGSSTLGASARFRDTLAGRKAEVWLTPMVLADLADFEQPDIPHRLLHGGLPPFFAAESFPERDFQEWVDAYWAKDILELFRLEKRQSFQKLLELLMAQSGGIFEATRFARACEVSRTTVTNYLAVLEATFVVHVIRPFSSRGTHEVVAAPKIYAFDTGFVCFYRGWSELRSEDRGPLWEHVVLNEMNAQLQSRRIHYWRSKQGHEVDLVLAGRGRPPAAIECKWSAGAFDPASLEAFRRRHPRGENFVVSADVDRPFQRRHGGILVRHVGLPHLIAALAGRGVETPQRRA